VPHLRVGLDECQILDVAWIVFEIQTGTSTDLKNPTANVSEQL
jgi:hypothetical protein